MRAPIRISLSLSLLCARLRHQLADNVCCIIFCSGASAAGYLLYSRTAGAGLITKLAVGAAFRRRGIGSLLLRRGVAELERPARRSAPAEIQLHVDPSNVSARKLYESVGFQLVTLLPQYYSDSRDALLMRRPTRPGPS